MDKPVCSGRSDSDVPRKEGEEEASKSVKLFSKSMKSTLTAIYLPTFFRRKLCGCNPSHM